MNPDSDITELKGIGAVLASKYHKLDIYKIKDLIDYYPKKYDDYSRIDAINQLKPGLVSLKAVIKESKGRYVRKGLHITEAIASDDSGSVRLVWFNQPYRSASIKLDQDYYITGNFELSRGRFAINNPSLELATELKANKQSILAIYKETKGLDSKQIRQAIKQVEPVIKDLPETLPDWIVKDLRLISLAEATRTIHLPKNNEELNKARHRLGFEEVFRFSLASYLNKVDNNQLKSVSIAFNLDLARSFVSSLPFKLTDGQRKTVWQIYKDLEKPNPMNRLVEGDVGSGKTVVAAMAGLMVINKQQVAFMAPTELLARQHADTLFSLLKPLKKENELMLLVGSMTKAQKDKAHKAIKDNKARFIIGTQTLIQDKIDMHKLALVIIDEQHRFGVEQRKALMKKAGHMPHLLSLTATPIPRSLALTLYGELDISILKEKPLGRQEIATRLIFPGEKARLMKELDEELASGRQMFVVCPSISESSILDVSAAETVYEEYKSVVFKHRRVGLLHGKLKADQKLKIMDDFTKGKLDILVSTTVIEVGVDVSNASIMLILSPERFGLAQLHQLRGRVGRGEHKGYCFLLCDNDKVGLKRLRALSSSNDGFKLAELDLNLRGPGAIYGTSQHGVLDLRIAKLTDTELINEAINAAKQFVNRGENLLKYTELNRRVSDLRAVTNLN